MCNEVEIFLYSGQDCMCMFNTAIGSSPGVCRWTKRLEDVLSLYTVANCKLPEVHLCRVKNWPVNNFILLTPKLPNLNLPTSTLGYSTSNQHKTRALTLINLDETWLLVSVKKFTPSQFQHYIMLYGFRVRASLKVNSKSVWLGYEARLCASHLDQVLWCSARAMPAIRTLWHHYIEW